jgi:hypothetical protein
MSKILPDLLNEAEKNILLKLEFFFEKKGLLSGGTALMLQIPKRRSFDFDLFFPFEIPLNFLRKANEIFGSKLKLLINNSDELSFISEEKVKVSFIYFPFKRKYELVKIFDFVSLSSYKDIASDKAYAIGRRPEYRDYVDLFFILKDGLTIKKIIEDAKEKFSAEFSEKLFLSQLIYFEDIKDFTIEYISDPVDLEEIKSFFKNIVSGYKKLF